MEAIKAIAKRTKTGKYRIDLPINNDAEEIAVMVIVAAVKKEKSIEEFCRKNEQHY